jgi:hypothetical protein
MYVDVECDVWRRPERASKHSARERWLAYTIFPVGAMLSGGGCPVARKMAFLLHCADRSKFAQNMLIHPFFMTSELPS